jgi:glutamate-1-semialdehyde 2,1-aminomutase
MQLSEPASDLRSLRAACDRTGSVLILDETKTAFRIAMGGVQELTGVKADLTIAGKAMANGLPLSCVVGRAELLGRRSRAKGTFSSELAAMAASLATLAVLDDVDGCARITEIGGQLLDGLQRVLADHPVGQYLSAVPYRWPAMPHVHARSDDPIGQRCRTTVLRETAMRGALLLDKHPSFVGITHTKADVMSTTDAFRAAADSWVARRRPGPLG